MCMAIPMQVKTLVDGFATCEAKGVSRKVSLMMINQEEIEKGDHLLVHVGFAIQKIDKEEAESRWQMLDEILDTLGGNHA